MKKRSVPKKKMVYTSEEDDPRLTSDEEPIQYSDDEIQVK